MIDWKPIAEKFREADAILIGASNGLSITCLLYTSRCV